MNATLAQRRYRLGARLFTRTARSFLWWLIGGAAVTFTISAVFADVLDMAAWAVTASIFQWFVAVSAGMVIPLLLPAQIAMGLTRREVTGALGVFGALLCAGAVLIVAVGFLAEYVLLSALAEPPSSFSGALAQAARYLVVTPLYCIAGMVIGAVGARMRNNGVHASALLVAGAALAAVCMWFEYSAPWSAVWAATALAFLGASTAVFTLVLRSIPIHPKRA